MSAWVVSREHIDLLVKAAIHYGSTPNLPEGVTEVYSSAPQAELFGWWQVDEEGCFSGWRHLVLANPDHRDEWYEPSQLGQILVSENVASVAFRYSEPGRTPYYGAEEAAALGADLDPDAGELPGPVDAYYMAPYMYRDPGYVLTPGEVFSAIDCLDYQSCEHDGWRASEAYAFLRSLRHAACGFVDGHRGSPWGWEAKDIAARTDPFAGEEGVVRFSYSGAARIVRPLRLRESATGTRTLVALELSRDGIVHADPQPRSFSLDRIADCTPPLHALLARLAAARR